MTVFLLIGLPYVFVLFSFAHLITLSALASTFGGIVKPICFAVLRLMMNSNFFGCSTGRSAGLAPFKNFVHIRSGVQGQSVLFTP